MLQGQPLHPLKHALHIFTDASKGGWGAHSNEHTARGTWPLPESKLHINCLELKTAFLVLKEFQNLCSGQIVLVATDIHKQGRRYEVGLTVCPSVENSDLVFKKTGDFQASPSKQSCLAFQRSSSQYAAGGAGLK